MFPKDSFTHGKGARFPGGADARLVTTTFPPRCERFSIPRCFGEAFSSFLISSTRRVDPTLLSHASQVLPFLWEGGRETCLCLGICASGS